MLRTQEDDLLFASLVINQKTENHFLCAAPTQSVLPYCILDYSSASSSSAVGARYWELGSHLLGTHKLQQRKHFTSASIPFLICFSIGLFVLLCLSLCFSLCF